MECRNSVQISDWNSVPYPCPPFRMVGFREDRQRTACQRGSALTLCARLRRMLFVPLDRTGWRAAGEREERAGSNILFLRCVCGRSGQEATFCSTVSTEETKRPCTMEARKATKKTKGPCTMEKALCSFVRWKPQRPNARVRWKRLCSFVLPDSV